MFIYKTVFRGDEPTGDVVNGAGYTAAFPAAPTVVSGTKSLAALIRGRSRVVFHLAKNRELAASLMCSSQTVRAEVSNGRHELASALVCRSDAIRCALVPAVHVAALPASRSSASISLNVGTLVEVAATFSCTTATTLNLSAELPPQIHLDGTLACRTSASAYVSSPVFLSASPSSATNVFFDLRAGKIELGATLAAVCRTFWLLQIDHVANMASTVAATSTASCALSYAVRLGAQAQSASSATLGLDVLNNVSADAYCVSFASASLLRGVELSAFAQCTCTARCRLFLVFGIPDAATVETAIDEAVSLTERDEVWIINR